MANANMFLFWGSGSAPCWKPMIVLAEKNLWKDCPNKLIEFSKKEHKSEEVMKLNSRGQVPTFKDGDVTVHESGAICMYLQNKLEAGLIPTDPADCAACYQKMFESNNIQSNVMLPLIYYKMRTPKEELDQEKIKEAFVKAKEEMKFWEASLDGKEFLAGKAFSMADVFFFPLLATIKRQGAELAEFPNLNKYYNAVRERPSIKETWPPHWVNTDNLTNLLGL